MDFFNEMYLFYIIFATIKTRRIEVLEKDFVLRFIKVMTYYLLSAFKILEPFRWSYGTSVYSNLATCLSFWYKYRNIVG